jgi:cephalosporin hydroxylase
MTYDDRKEFDQRREQNCLALGGDPTAFAHSLSLLTELDQYDYSYLWTWMGVPIIQMPADILATQEVIWKTKPDIIIETGVARGGSVLFMASILELVGKGRVIGVDIDIRPHNRDAIESHPLSRRVDLVQGGSADADTLLQVKRLIPPDASVMVVLDSDHSRQHVLEECRAYGPLVTPGCYLVVADTLVGHVDAEQAPKKRSKLWFKGDDPLSAMQDYLQEEDGFEQDPILNGKLVLSSSPGGYLRRRL